MAKKVAESQKTVTFNGRELRIKDLQEALRRYFNQEGVHMTIGCNRRPGDTDYIPVAVHKDGTIETWKIYEQHGTVGGRIGVTDVLIGGSGTQHVWVRYNAPAETMEVVTSVYAASV